MTLFGAEVFLETLAEVFHPGRRARIGVVEVQGRAFRLPVLDGHEVVTRAPFFDFVPPLQTPWPGQVRTLAHLPHAVLATELAAGPLPPAPGHHLAPFIDWSGFDDWPAFEGWVAGKLSTLWRDSRRRLRKLEQELGPVRLCFDDGRPETFEACLRWKSAQYRATGVPDMFAAPENVALFRRLQERGAVVVSSLNAGDRVVAAVLGGLADGWYASWVPSFDPALASYSPGRLLLHQTLEESYARGHLQFDFLVGEEPYKFHYATHCRTIGPLGPAPLKERLVRELSARTRHALEHHPELYRLARLTKQRLLGGELRTVELTGRPR